MLEYLWKTRRNIWDFVEYYNSMLMVENLG